MQSNLCVHTKYENMDKIYLYPIWEYFLTALILFICFIIHKCLKTCIAAFYLAPESAIAVAHHAVRVLPLIPAPPCTSSGIHTNTYPQWLPQMALLLITMTREFSPVSLPGLLPPFLSAYVPLLSPPSRYHPHSRYRGNKEVALSCS